MDEQQEQAVLDVEEIETDSNYDYLSILHEMQQSLGTDENSAAVYQTTNDVPDAAAVTPLTEAARTSVAEDEPPANSDFAIDDAEPITAKYLADAPTQPLPELPTNFDDGMMFEDSLFVDQTAAAINRTSYSNGFGEHSENDSMNDFAELSPILFDAGESEAILEPDFGADLATGELKMIMPKTATENLPDNLSEDATDEMPTSLAFGEMLAEDSSDVAIGFAPPVEAESALSHETFDEMPDFEDPIALLSKPSGNEQNSHPSENVIAPGFANLSAETVGETTSIEDSADFALPEMSIFAQNNDDLMPEPSFAMFDAEDDLADSKVPTEIKADESQTGDAEDAEDLSLLFPTFLQADLAAHSKAQESLTEPSFEANSFADENTATETASASEEFFAASLSEENKQVGNIVFDEHLFADETAEMPETLFSESLSANFAEPDDFGELPTDLLSEMPETLLLDSTSATSPEADFSEFDAPPAPAFEEVDLQLAETLLDLTLAAPSPNLVSKSVPSLAADMADSVSFLKERFIIFKLDNSLYAFSAANVTEIGQLLPITPLPFVPSWFLGISNLRGNILSVVGLHELWKKNTVSPQNAKILVLHSNNHHLTVGLVVDAVREMRHVAPEEIAAGDPQTGSPFAAYQIGMIQYEKQNLCLLDAEKLISTLKT